MAATSVTGIGKGSKPSLNNQNIGVNKISIQNLPVGASMILVLEDKEMYDKLPRSFQYQASYIVTKDGEILKDRDGRGVIPLPTKVVRRCDQRYRSIDET